MSSNLYKKFNVCTITLYYNHVVIGQIISNFLVPLIAFKNACIHLWCNLVFVTSCLSLFGEIQHYLSHGSNLTLSQLSLSLERLYFLMEYYASLKRPQHADFGYPLPCNASIIYINLLCNTYNVNFLHLNSVSS